MIGHIQFADCPGRHEPDTAQIDFPNVFKWLSQSHYSGYIAAEYKPQSHSNQSLFERKIFPIINLPKSNFTHILDLKFFLKVGILDSE